MRERDAIVPAAVLLHITTIIIIIIIIRLSEFKDCRCSLNIPRRRCDGFSRDAVYYLSKYSDEYGCLPVCSSLFCSPYLKNHTGKLCQ